MLVFYGHVCQQARVRLPTKPTLVFPTDILVVIFDPAMYDGSVAGLLSEQLIAKKT